MKYYINFGTGAGDYSIDAENLEAAQASADENAAYTQASIVIRDEDGKALSVRRWVPIAYGSDESQPEESNCINFGDFGYYTDWDSSRDTCRAYSD